MADMTAEKWKDMADGEFKHRDWSTALIYYTNALNLVEDNAEKAVYHVNRASAYFMMHEYWNVIEECDSALMICSNDPDALFNRCQALQALERFEEAHQDAKIILLFDPNNIIILLIEARLQKIVDKRREENASISPEISQLMDLVFNVNTDEEKRETAMNNLLVLARERAGAEEIFKKEGVSKIAQLVKVEKNEKLVSGAICIVGELCESNINRIESVVKYVGLPWCLEILDTASTERINAFQYCLQNILNTYSGMSNTRYSIPDEASCKVHKKQIDTILWCLLEGIMCRTITGLARNALIEFIMRNINYTALNWSKQLVELGGLKSLMEVASEMEEYKYESSMDITSSTRAITSMCLARTYENLYCAKDKNTFLKVIDKLIKDKLLRSDVESKI